MNKVLSLRWRLPLLVVGVIVVVLSAFTWVAYTQMEKTLIEAGRSRAQGAADELVGLLAPSRVQRSAKMKRLASSAVLRDALLTDSDEARAAAEAAVRSLGTTGRQVIELSREGARLIALATHVVMPDMNGATLSREMFRHRPSLRALFKSGFSDDAIEHHGVSAGTAFLQKPFTAGDLTRHVRQVLDEPAAEPASSRAREYVVSEAS